MRTIPLKEFYIACRADNGIRDSIRLTAEYRGITREEVCEALDLDEKFAQPHNGLEAAGYKRWKQ